MTGRPPVFITDHFLLRSDSAVKLYHDYAKQMPIVDYHCHLPPKDIAEDRRFENLTRIWLEGDHYKWRAMRTAGVDEHYITGDASDREKFQKWAETTPQTLRNPLYHWTHLELNRPFGINDRLLGPETAESIWNEANDLLSRPEFSARGIMKQMDVRLVCTTDDPTDSLDDHRAIREDTSFDIKVLPTFRPDKALQIFSPVSYDKTIDQSVVDTYNQYLDRLADIAGVTIETFDDLLEALKIRHDFFHAAGCRLSDHAFEQFDFTDDFLSDGQSALVPSLFIELRRGQRIGVDEARSIRSALILRLAEMNAEKGWTMQLHIGALRNNNNRAFRTLGPDTGFDSIADGPVAAPLARFFDRLDRKGMLPKTILYNLNPSINEVLATMIGNFQDGKIPGKMQFGSGWWFLDQKDGMEKQLDAVSNLGLLRRFIGMLTDSRSFLSYTRHEYFRRILCNLLGREIDEGTLPRDFDLVGNMVRDICYNNIVDYLGL